MKMITKLFTLLAISTLLFAVAGCQQQQRPANTIKVGTIDGPETKLMEVAKKVAKQKYRLNIEIVKFSDYTTPNIALNEGSIDANMFQHQPFLDTEIKDRNFKIVAIGKTFLYPMGIYSKKINSLDQLKAGDIVAIPNDPSNETRALRLLQAANIITLKPNSSMLATTLDIAGNPNNLIFKELDAAQLARSLNDVTIAVINTNYAIPAGLSPSKDALFIESKNSPYANIVAVRIKDKNKKQLHELVKALQSKAVLQEAKKLFGNNAIPAWRQNNTK